MKNGKEKGNISFGTFFMLFVTLLVVGGLGYVIPKLGSGNEVDLSKLKVDEILSIVSGKDTGVIEEIPLQQNPTHDYPLVQSTKQPETHSTAAPLTEADGSIRIVFAGTVSVEDAVRKSAYLNDSKTYDFSENLALIREEAQADISCVFLENLLLDHQKVSNLVIPSSGADIIRSGGFDTVCYGFPKVLDKGIDGLNVSLAALTDRALNVIGAYGQESAAGGVIRTVNGIRVALLQFTSALTSSGQKTAKKSGNSMLVPIADENTIRAGVRSARDAGAQIVVVCLNWGSDGSKAPTQKQRKLAQSIADAGADVIVGTGSGIVQNVEYLTVENENGNRNSVLCAWSLGTLLAESRKSNRTAGILLQLEMRVDGNGRATVQKAEYIPTWIWQYKQDGVTYYKTIPADRNQPDGMADNDIKAMNKAADLIMSVMKESPLEKKEVP